MIINNLRHNQSRSLFPLKSPFRPLFGAFCPQISAESGSGHPPSRTRETWLATNVHLATVLPPHAPRPTPHDVEPSGVRSRADPSPAGYCHPPTAALTKIEGARSR